MSAEVALIDGGPKRRQHFNGRGERADPSCRPAKRAEVSLKERTRASSQPRPGPLYSPSGEIHKLKSSRDERARKGRTHKQRKVTGLKKLNKLRDTEPGIGNG
jgi:hypothetical protein